MEKVLRIGIVVGEASGDILGSSLIKALKVKHPNAKFEGIGGPLMIAEGFDSHVQMDRLSVMGYVEPLKRLPELLRIRKNTIQHFLNNPPDIFLGIDSPDFNLTIERTLKENNIKTAHYVSPSVWAWKKKRIFKIAKSVDLMLTLFPFETAIYEEHNIPVKFVGHPLADEFEIEPAVVEAREALNIPLSEKVVALLPGSRGGEVKLLGRLFLETARRAHQIDERLTFLLPAANPQRRAQIDVMMEEFTDLPVRILEGTSHQAMTAADAVLMASGTTTLEAMLLKKPMVVAYKLAPISYAIISRLITTEFISLPNLLAGKALVPEFIQGDATVEQLVPALLNCMDNVGMRTQLGLSFTEIHQSIRCDASRTAADALLELI